MEQEIIGVLAQLNAAAPAGVVDYPVHINRYGARNLNALFEYANRLTVLYASKKPYTKTYREFIDCMIAMAYWETLEYLRNNAILDTPEGADARLEYMNLIANIIQSVHNKLSKIGRSAFRFADIFNNLSSLSIFIVRGLSSITRLTNNQFDAFAAHVQDEFDRNTGTTIFIRGIHVNQALLNMFGDRLPPRLRELVLNGDGNPPDDGGNGGGGDVPN